MKNIQIKVQRHEDGQRFVAHLENRSEGYMGFGQTVDEAVGSLIMALASMGGVINVEIRNLSGDQFLRKKTHPLFR